MAMDGRMKRLGIKECGLLFQKLNYEEHKSKRMVPQGRHKLKKTFKIWKLCTWLYAKGKSQGGGGVEKIEHNEEKG